ncbi:MAG: SufD family Fe-S cluster assembly protein [Alphaproteobacteria bacterium]|nr:MAG: SufD family Fe-S cluster assembly protein [Alphaproteobacteria bacterium]
MTGAAQMVGPAQDKIPAWPSPRQEDWRWTPVARLNEAEFGAASAHDPLPLVGESSGLRIVVDEAGLCARLSTLDALEKRGLHLRHGQMGAESADPIPAFVAATTARSIDIHLDPGAVLADPVEIVFCASAQTQPAFFAHRINLHLGRGAELTLIERRSCAPGAPILMAHMRQTMLQPQARLHRLVIEPRSADMRTLSHETTHLDQDAALHEMILTQGGRLTRHERHVHLEARGAQAHLGGVLMPDHDNHAQILTFMHHDAPHTTSRQVFRSLADGTSSAAFQGRIVVAKGAMRADASQSHKGLLLAKGAAIHTKPELEINADDVRCAHGAAIGTLDADALFYLRARGLTEAAAHRLLTAAFARQALEAVPDLSAKAWAQLRPWMDWPDNGEED